MFCLNNVTPAQASAIGIAIIIIGQVIVFAASLAVVQEEQATKEEEVEKKIQYYQNALNQMHRKKT